ncbi:type 1 fimbrial protein [Escherichia coli]|nr:type 1 fimbrial protein [Escherichia coli]EKD5851057.1 type 1 fimbrial protein [Escherichia coli]
MKYNNIIFLGLCLGLTTYSALSADSVIKISGRVLDEGSNTASGLGIEILDANMRPVKLNDLHAGMQWIPLVPEQNNILPYSARLKSTQKSVNPGLVRASATFTLEFQ